MLSAKPSGSPVVLINSCLLSDPCLPKSLAIVLLAFGVFPFLLAGYAAAAIGTDMAWRSGSYTSPFTHSRCSNIASFRATATAALFFAFFPPRSQSRSPYRRKSVSGPNGIVDNVPTASTWSLAALPSRERCATSARQKL